MTLPIIRPALAVAAALTIGGCADYGHQGYGYNRVAVGYSNYDYPYYGWYGDSYYPGVGYYVYDRHGSRHRWNDRQRRYWQGRGEGRHGHENWSGYNHERRNGRDDDRKGSDWGHKRFGTGDNDRDDRRERRHDPDPR